MKLIVFSAPKEVHKEVATVIRLFDKGLANFHLRKPAWTEEQHIEFLNQIPANYYSNIILHYHHQLLASYDLRGIHLTAKVRKSFLWDQQAQVVSTSFHGIDELLAADFDYEYCFLSPIFDSISKPGYASGFTSDELSELLASSNLPVVALGGISSKNIRQVREMGFYGAAFLGAIWQSANPVEEFEVIRSLLS